jgi:NAD-dependent deacetylase
MRPDVVWFGEMLPADQWEQAERACLACDLMLVVGTAAEVYPAAGLIGLAHSGGAKIVVINTNPSEASGIADVELIGPAGQILPPLLGIQDD